MAEDVGDVIECDPEVRQARMIADAARTRLVACVSGPSDEVDLAEAGRMLEALGSARALAEDAADLVLVDRGLLTGAEAARRARRRRPAPPPRDPAGPGRAGPARRDGSRRRSAARRAVITAALVAACLAAVAVALRPGWRPPRVRPRQARP